MLEASPERLNAACSSFSQKSLQRRLSRAVCHVRAETEHRFLKLLAKRQAGNRRRRALKEWIVVTSMAGKNGQSRP